MFGYLIEKLADGINKMEAHKSLKDKEKITSEFKYPKLHSKTRIRDTYNKKIEQVLKHISDVCYILCSAQNSLENLFDTSKKMAQIVRTKYFSMD